MTNPIIVRNKKEQSIPGRRGAAPSTHLPFANNSSGTKSRPLLDRRSFLTGLGALGASLWVAPSAGALGLPEDKIKVVRYFSNTGDTNGQGGQPMVNQSNNVVVIETERGLIGIGEGGEPRTMDECASMLIGLDPYRIDNLWQRMMRGYFYPAGREKTHSLGALDLALWDLKGKALDVPIWQLLGGKSRNHVELYSTVFPDRTAEHWKTPRERAEMRGSELIATPPTTRANAKWIASSWSVKCTRTVSSCTRALATAVGPSTFTRSWIYRTPSTWRRCSNHCIPISAKTSSAVRMFCLMSLSVNEPACPSQWANSSATSGT